MLSFVFNWIIKLTAFPLYLIIFRPKTYYLDKSVQSRKIKGKAIVVSNHTSVYDVARLMFTFTGRTLRVVAAEILFAKNLFFTAFLKCLGAIKVDRGINDFSFLAKCKRLLSRGGVVEIYPESRLPDKNASDLLPFKSSTVYMALENDTPIIPVYTDGNYFNKRRACLIIGTPFIASDHYDATLSQSENLQILTDKLRNVIKDLKNELEGKKQQTQKR